MKDIKKYIKKTCSFQILIYILFFVSLTPTPSEKKRIDPYVPVFNQITGLLLAKGANMCVCLKYDIHFISGGLPL